MFEDELFDEELKRIQFEFEDSPADVDCLKDLNLTKLDGKKITFKKGMKIKLPYWLALLLDNEGYVKLLLTEKIDYPSVYKITLNELEQRSLQGINKYFYILLKRRLDEFKAQNRQITFNELHKIEIEVRKLMTSRLSKILKIAEKGRNITNMVRNMTPEEKWLYQLVSDAVKSWKTIWKAEESEEKEENK